MMLHNSLMEMGYLLFDIKKENLMYRKRISQHPLNDNETILIDIGPYLKFTNN